MATFHKIVTNNTNLTAHSSELCAMFTVINVSSIRNQAVYVIIGKNPKVITPTWVGMGHVWKYYTEYKCLLSLHLKVHCGGRRNCFG